LIFWYFDKSIDWSPCSIRSRLISNRFQIRSVFLAAKFVFKSATNSWVIGKEKSTYFQKWLVSARFAMSVLFRRKFRLWYAAIRFICIAFTNGWRFLRLAHVAVAKSISPKTSSINYSSTKATIVLSNLLRSRKTLKFKRWLMEIKHQRNNRLEMVWRLKECSKCKWLFVRVIAWWIRRRHQETEINKEIRVLFVEGIIPSRRDRNGVIRKSASTCSGKMHLEFWNFSENCNFDIIFYNYSALIMLPYCCPKSCLLCQVFFEFSNFISTHFHIYLFILCQVTLTCALHFYSSPLWLVHW